ncbi:MAG: transglutaminase family protein [Bacteroidota bacterium]
MQEYLQATSFMDYEQPIVQDFIQKNTKPGASLFDNALQLFYAVRDQIRYDPYSFSDKEENFKASYVLEQQKGWCVPKSVLYGAVCRAIGVPAQLGFADVKNHLSTENMRKKMKTDIFHWHGYTSVYLKDKWVKATPAFNIQLTEKFRLKPLDFNGLEDSIYHEFDQSGNKHMEYLKERGLYADLPLAEMLKDFDLYYPNYIQDGKGNFDQEVDQEVAQ